MSRATAGTSQFGCRCRCRGDIDLNPQINCSNKLSTHRLVGRGCRRPWQRLALVLLARNGRHVSAQLLFILTICPPSPGPTATTAPSWLPDVHQFLCLLFFVLAGHATRRRRLHAHVSDFDFPKRMRVPGEDTLWHIRFCASFLFSLWLHVQLPQLLSMPPATVHARELSLVNSQALILWL